MREFNYRYFLLYMDSGDGTLRASAPQLLALNRSRTVERELVHRVSVAEVLLTDVRECGTGRFEAAACWPRSHPTFPRGRDDRHSPLVLVETVRQLGIYVPLRYYGVAGTAQFLIKNVSFTVDPLAEPRVDHGSSEVTCRVSVGEVRTGPDGAPRAMRMRMRFTAGERPGGPAFAHAEGQARFVAAGDYAVLRRGAGDTVSAPARGAVRPDPAALGVAAACDVLIGLDRDALVLDPADARHPFLFDHGADHVPGMVLLEAARQAAAVRSAGRLLRPSGGQFKALRFTEHSPRAQVECAVYARTCVFGFRQGGALTAVGALHYP